MKGRQPFPPIALLLGASRRSDSETARVSRIGELPYSPSRSVTLRRFLPSAPEGMGEVAFVTLTRSP
jgi:hypothetical protein